jgi:hypothetical protein
MSLSSIHQFGQHLAMEPNPLLPLLPKQIMFMGPNNSRQCYSYLGTLLIGVIGKSSQSWEAIIHYSPLLPK